MQIENLFIQTINNQKSTIKNQKSEIQTLFSSPGEA